MKFKKLKISLLSAIICCSTLNSSYADESIHKEKIVHNQNRDAKGTWIQSNGKWWFKYTDGHYSIGWDMIDEVWYYFDNDGWMKSDEWIKPDGKWYYLNNNGSMAKGLVNIKGIDYKFAESGHLLHAGDMQVSIFGNDYNRFGSDKLNTNPDVDIVKNLFSNTSYDIFAFKNFERYNFFSKNNVDKPLINSGIFLYSGHGSEDGSLYLGPNKKILPSELPYMNNTKVAFFFNCYGGVDKGVAMQAVLNGAKASYGYKNLSLTLEDRKIIEFMIDKMLNNSYTLDETINMVKSKFYDYSVVKNNYIVSYGDSNTKISNYGISRTVPIMLKDILNKKELSEYIIKDNVGKKYYRNILTSDSFSLKNNGEVLDYNIKLSKEILSKLDKVIDKKGDGIIYDDIIIKSLSKNENLNTAFTLITSKNNVAKIIRKYYISDKENTILLRTRYIDIETGIELEEEIAENMLSN